MADYNSTHTGAFIDTTITNADAGNIGKGIVRSNINLDNLSTGFDFSLNTGTNIPVASNTAVVTIEDSAGTRSGQLAITESQQMFFRENFGSWQELYHTANLQIETTAGLGVVKLMRNGSASTLADGDSAPGSSLTGVKFDDAGNITPGAVASGTWKNVTGASIAQNETGYFVRTA